MKKLFFALLSMVLFATACNTTPEMLEEPTGTLSLALNINLPDHARATQEDMGNLILDLVIDGKDYQITEEASDIILSAGEHTVQEASFMHDGIKYVLIQPTVFNIRVNETTDLSLDMIQDQTDDHLGETTISVNVSPYKAIEAGYRVVKVKNGADFTRVDVAGIYELKQKGFHTLRMNNGTDEPMKFTVNDLHAGQTEIIIVPAKFTYFKVYDLAEGSNNVTLKISYADVVNKHLSL
ncbi:hypothetical protein [Persicobacter psychrovividus]|uniref:DUF4382 domain-containing protein n=1 Tax=Persicobacter psychrovividus TaxID=387638 RepID=A0ABN6LCX7_9BACT|nr:hypothetical protein PEPS_14520 [Persicobacter psychrovividus]